MPPYASDAAKWRDAARHQRDDGIPWPVLTDDLRGTVHRAYGMLADPTFLIDAQGRLSFYNAITHAPTLHRALQALRAQGDRGVVLGGFDRRVHALPVIAGGWPALQRGLAQSAVDLETAMPTGALVPFLGYQMRPVLAPLALRSEPLPPRARTALTMAGAAALAIGWALTRRNSPRHGHQS